MEDKEKLSLKKNKRSKKEEKLIIKQILRRKIRSMTINIKLFVSLIILIAFLFVVVILLLFGNRRLSNKLNKFQYDYINNVGNNVTFLINNREKSNTIKKLFGYKIEEYENNNLNQIHISYSLDNKIIYPTLVSMISGLENNNNKMNIIIYHLLLSHDFNTSNIEIFETLKIYYTVKINYYIIPNIFTGLRKWTEKTGCIYNKILLPIMLPDLERILFLDGDTLIRKDLSEIINYSFNDNYILGPPFYMTFVMDKHGINAEHYINAGCLLFNIKKIRKDHKDVDLLQFTIKNNSVLKFPEQDSINFIFYPKIGFLPLKYGIYMIGTKKQFKRLSTFTRSPLNLTEGYEAVDDPAIVHFSCCWPKVWTNGTQNLFKDNEVCERYQKEFYYYAKKSQYYSVIYNELFFNKEKEK